MFDSIAEGINFFIMGKFILEAVVTLVFAPFALYILYKFLKDD